MTDTALPRGPPEALQRRPQPSGSRTLRRRPTDINVHETSDAEVIVPEFVYEGTVVETGEPFTIPTVFVMHRG